MTNFAIIALYSALYLMSLASLIFVRYQKRFAPFRLALKAATSVGFLGLVLLCYFLGNTRDFDFFVPMLACFLFCALGDVLLALASKKSGFFSRYFLRGVASFAVAHAGFCAVYTFRTFAKAPLIAWYELLFVALGFCAALICVKSPKFRMKKMTVPALFYSICVCAMCAKAFTFCMVSEFSPRGAFILLGSVLFLISDFVLLFVEFYQRPRKTWMAVNLGTYYVAMMVLAFGVY